MTFRQIFLACLAAMLPTLAAPQTAFATPRIAMDSAVFVERAHAGDRRRLEPVGQLARGDRVVTVLNWHRMGGNNGANGGFTITNPLPRSVAYQASAHEDEEVSVDGGKSWGKLGALRIGTRLATPEDVTHVRWHVSPALAQLGNGSIAYSGIVR